MNEQEKPKKSPPESKPPRRIPVDPQRAAMNERAWADRMDEPAPEPREETYRDGSMKNECW